MKMRNEEVEAFVEFIMGEDLGAKLSRMRTRFATLAKDHIAMIGRERMELIGQYCEKDEEGELVTIEDANTGQMKYKIADLEGFNKDFVELMNEDFIVEASEDKKEMLECIKAIVLNTPRMLKGNAALEYDRFCDIVEELVK